jgi:hypothetical protein
MSMRVRMFFFLLREPRCRTCLVVAIFCFVFSVLTMSVWVYHESQLSASDIALLGPRGWLNDDVGLDSRR